MSSFSTTALGLVATTAALGTLTLARAHSQTGPSPEAQARSVAEKFFGAVNTQRYDVACSLLSRRYYREHHVRDRKSCVLGLTVGLRLDSVRFEITGVRRRGPEIEVTALANGMAGRVILTRERGRFRILALRSQ
jgi:hypothetical protein